MWGFQQFQREVTRVHSSRFDVLCFWGFSSYIFCCLKGEKNNGFWQFGYITNPLLLIFVYCFVILGFFCLSENFTSLFRRFFISFYWLWFLMIILEQFHNNKYSNFGTTSKVCSSYFHNIYTWNLKFYLATWKSLKINSLDWNTVHGVQNYHTLMKLKCLLTSTSKLSSCVIQTLAKLLETDILIIHPNIFYKLMISPIQCFWKILRSRHV